VPDNVQLTYLFDPLCGWCYGASPVLDQLMREDGIAVTMAPTGLFAGGGAFALDAGFAAHAWEADQRIGQLSGQPFSPAYRKNVLESGTARVDSGPATLALTAVRLSAPEREFETLHAIQRARYVDGRDNGNPEVIGDVLASLHLDEAATRFAAPDNELLSITRARIEHGQAEMRRVNASGVPTLVLHDGEHRRVISSNVLYGDADGLIASLRADVH